MLSLGVLTIFPSFGIFLFCLLLSKYILLILLFSMGLFILTVWLFSYILLGKNNSSVFNGYAWVSMFG